MSSLSRPGDSRDSRDLKPGSGMRRDYGREEGRYEDRREGPSRWQREERGSRRGDEYYGRREGESSRSRGYDESRRTYDDRNRVYDRRDTRARDYRTHAPDDARNRDHERTHEPNSERRRRSASPPARKQPSRTHSRSPSHSEPPEDKAKPNFNASGLLAAETNTVRKTDGSSTLLKYNEPPEARKPAQDWRLYVFKGKEEAGLFHIARQSAYLFGRDHAVADVALDHPSCSKQHAVVQYRQVTEKDEYGGSKPVVKPFVIDLDSTNGTHVNDETIPTTRFYELKVGDVLKFGQSTKEYVLLHDEAS